MLTVVLQELAAKLADLFPRLMGMLTPSRNPRQEKKCKGKTSPKPAGEAPQPFSRAQKSLTGEQQGNPATMQSLGERQEKQARSPRLYPG